MWKNDNFFIGTLAAVLSIIITAGLIILIAPLVYSQLNLGIPQVKILLLAVFPAVIIMRYYFRKLKFSKSGSGALIIVFLSIILYYVFVEGKIDTFPFI